MAGFTCFGGGSSHTGTHECDGTTCVAAMANVKLWRGEVPNTLRKRRLPQLRPSATKNHWSSDDSDSLGSLSEVD